MFLPKKIIEEKILSFLKEDTGLGDSTTALLIPPDVTVEAKVVAKEDGVIAGIDEALILIEALGLKAEVKISDGEEVRKDNIILKIRGNAQTLLTAERTMLNLLSRMSGIATATKRLVNKLEKAGFRTKVASTRKTAPGLAYFDKKAVKAGGGDTHRLHLDDMVLIKDNHVAITKSISKAVREARKRVSFSKKIEVEVSNVKEAVEAAKAGADIIMLDNFSPEQAKKAIKALEEEGLRAKILIEASGGITEKNILKYASIGVDIVSLGELTHSIKSLDMNLEIIKKAK
jgi:nicotinate-nucleotide pyrophosphorylase (carboxylating)